MTSFKNLPEWIALNTQPVVDELDQTESINTQIDDLDFSEICRNCQALTGWEQLRLMLTGSYFGKFTFPFLEKLETLRNSQSTIPIPENAVLLREHFDELLNSTIDPEIAALNFRSLGGSAAIEYIASNVDLPRRNDGRLRDGAMRKYDFLSNGGWWCSGIDIFTGDDSLWGCLKPDTPRIDREKHKPIKYEHPHNTPTEAFFLRVTPKIWALIARHYNVLLPNDYETLPHAAFWRWVIDNNLPIIITEGAKKTAALLSQGFIAVGLPGIWGGVRKSKNEDGEPTGEYHLIPQLKPFCTEGRQIDFCFDQDEKVKTVRNVNLAITRTAKLFTDSGCQCNVITWDKEWGKGIDDVIFNGVDFNEIYHSSLSLKEWEKWQSGLQYEIDRQERAKFNFTRSPNIEIKSGFLPSLELKNIPSWLLAIKGDWGVGKSFLIASLLKEWQGKAIQVAHLNALLENTAPKFDLMSHKELKSLDVFLTSANRIAITDISLAALFDVERWGSSEPFILVLDENEQVLKSAQNNSNLKGGLRTKARAKLEWLIRNAAYVIVSDRDLCDETLQYIEQVRGEDKKAFVVQHTGKKGIGRKPIRINHNKQKDAIVTRIVEDAKAGKKIAVACENKSDLLALQKELEKAGVSDNTMFFAHGDNSNEPNIKIEIEQIDKVYTNYKILGYTMTLGTAISLEKEHFDHVYGIFTGDVLAASDQAQMLFRYRIDCDITIWVDPKKRRLEIDPKKLLSNLIKNIDETNNLIVSIDKLDELQEMGICPNIRGEISEFDIPWIEHKLGIIARTNASKANPFQTLYDLLHEDGFKIILECDDTEEESVKTIEGRSHKASKKENKEIDDKNKANSELMTEIEYQAAIMNPGGLTKKERDRLHKTKLYRDTGLEIDESIVRLNRTKNLVGGARLLNILLGDEATAAAYDLVDRERNPDQGDQHFYAQNRKFLCDLGIPEFIDFLRNGGEYFSQTPEVKAIADKARKRHKDFKRIIGQSISFAKKSDGSFKQGDCSIIAMLLDCLCIQRDARDVRGKGWVYKLDTAHWQLLDSIINHINSQSHTPTIDLVIKQAKTKAQQAIEDVSPPADCLYKEDKGVRQLQAIQDNHPSHFEAGLPTMPEFDPIFDEVTKIVPITTVRKVAKMTQAEMDEKINVGLDFIRQEMGGHTSEKLTAFFDLQGMTQADTKHIKKLVWEQLTTEEKLLILKSLNSQNIAA